MKGWQFAFEVDFTTLDAPPKTSEHHTVKKSMDHPGDYTIKRLFLDFKSGY